MMRAQLFQMDDTRIPFEGEFDVIGAFDVIEHIEDDQAALTSMFRALKPGGDLLLIVPSTPGCGARSTSTRTTSAATTGPPWCDAWRRRGSR